MRASTRTCSSEPTCGVQSSVALIPHPSSESDLSLAVVLLPSPLEADSEDLSPPLLLSESLLPPAMAAITTSPTNPRTIHFSALRMEKFRFLPALGPCAAPLNATRRLHRKGRCQMLRITAQSAVR